MTPIAAFDPALASGPSLDRVPPSPSTAPAVPTPIANTPAVIVSLSGVASTGATKLPEGNPLEISRTLASINGANGFLDSYNHIDWAAAEKQFGAAKINADKASVWIAAQGANSYVGSLTAKNSVIPVQGLVSTDTLRPGRAQKPITVGDFSFTHDGSVYAITRQKSGLTVGTKNGQYWEAWALNGALTLPNGLPATGVGKAKSDPLNIVT